VIRRHGHLGLGFLVFLGTLAAPNFSPVFGEAWCSLLLERSDPDIPILKEAKAEYAKLQ
jgi:hypothetical protein